MTLKDIVVGFGTTVRSIWMIGMHANHPDTANGGAETNDDIF